MTSLPFQLSTLLSGEEFSPTQHSGMRCCQPGSAFAQGQGSRRAKLSELDTQYHCSVIGTCLSTADLRKLIPRFVDVDRAKASDLDLHHEAVQLAFSVNLGSKAINKALDTRHELAIKKIHREKDPKNLRAFWSETAQVHAQLSKLLTLIDDLQGEVHAIEKELAGMHNAMHGDASRTRVLAERRILYVGGRPGSNRTIQAMVEAAGGEIVVHDGGIEDRKGLLAAALPRMDMVVFPVDCIDHDSMSTLKRACDKYQIAFYPVRTASAASFSALIARIAAPRQAASISRFCLKHG